MLNNKKMAGKLASWFMVAMIVMLVGCGKDVPSTPDTSPDTPVVEADVDTSVDVDTDTDVDVDANVDVVDEPVVDEPIVDTVDVVGEPVADVVDEPTVDVSTSIVYTNVQYSNCGDWGIVACFTRPDGSCDYAFFTAEMTVQGDAASIKHCNTGITFSALLDVDNLKYDDQDGLIVLSDKNYNILIVYSDSTEKILMDNTEGYSTIRNDHVEVVYNDTITDEQAQEILDSCVYYADGSEMQKQYQFMQFCVVSK